MDIRKRLCGSRAFVLSLGFEVNAQYVAALVGDADVQRAGRIGEYDAAALRVKLKRRERAACIIWSNVRSRLSM